MRFSAPTHFLVGLTIPLMLLSGCGGSSSTEVTCTQQYWNGTIGICLPTGWQIMERERLDQLGVGADTILALQTTKPVSGTLPNVTITTEILKRPTDTLTYSKASVRAVSALPGYQMIDERAVTVDGTASEIHVYSAQPAADQPKNRYYQLSAVSNGVGYTVTAFAPLSISQTLEQQILLMLGSFTFVQPKK